jgi:hypothetical protein
VSLPSFPVDDTTLASIEHALGASLTFDDDDVLLDHPRVVGADYTLTELLDFLAGVGDDPAGVLELVQESPEIWLDPRPHYSFHDVIRALIDEIHRLRASAELSV